MAPGDPASKAIFAALLLLAGVAAAGPVAPSADRAQPLAVGEIAPSASCRDVDGAPVPLDRYVGSEPVALIFYRGGW